MMNLKKFIYKNYVWEQQQVTKDKYHWVYSYKGKWKRWNLSGQKLFYNKLILCFVFLLCVFLFFHSSTIFCQINQIKIIQLLTLIIFSSLFFLFLGILNFIISKTKITESSAFMQKKLILWSAAVGCIFFILFNIFAVILLKFSLKKEDAYILLCNVAAALLELIILALQRKLIILDA